MQIINKYKWLAPSLLFSLVLLVLRVVHTHGTMFIFLLWNLFLACIPLLMSHIALHTRYKLVRILCGLVWLLFFPNSMYIITDLFHLKQRPDVPLWFDLLLLFSFALNGLILGFLSIINMEKAIQKINRKKISYLFTFSMFLLCGYGIYLGRYERWNSWDIITQPYSLLYSIAYDVIHPLRSAEVWVLSFCFAIWLYILYKHLKKIVSN